MDEILGKNDQKRFVISENWEQAVKYGFNSHSAMLSEIKFFSSSKECQKFIKDELPFMMEQFYQSVITKMKYSGIDKSEAIELAEENLAPFLEKSLINYGADTDQDLIISKEEVNV